MLVWLYCVGVGGVMLGGFLGGYSVYYLIECGVGDWGFIVVVRGCVMEGMDLLWMVVCLICF